mgnify:CR=1 FL=1
MAENLNISSVSGGYKSQSQLLVEAFKKTEQPKVDAILQKKQTLEKTREFFNSLFTKVSALNSSTDKFIGIDPKSKFKTRKITASDNSVLSVSASSNAIIGINSIKVLRLASYDILVSDRIDLSQNAESLFNGKNKLKPGTYSFKIASENKDLIEYTIELTGNETNEEIMTKIVNTINNNDNSTITASIVKDTETTGRLSFISKETGSNNKIIFQDSITNQNNNNIETNSNHQNHNNKGLLKVFGLDENLNNTIRPTFTETTAGYKTTDPANLDAKLEVNSIPITRSSNTIKDVLPGITINLLKPQNENDLPITLTTEVDVGAVRDLIQPTLKAYNEILTFLNQNKTIMRNDSTVNTLYNTLRLIISEPITQSEPDDYKYLTEIGIKINTDGSLTIDDNKKLQEILEQNPNKVAHLFVSQDSFIKKIQRAIENLTGPNGIIKSRTMSLSSQIDAHVKRQEELEQRIDREANALRKEYESMLAVFLEAQSQFKFLSALPTAGSNNYLSLLS